MGKEFRPVHACSAITQYYTAIKAFLALRPSHGNGIDKRLRDEGSFLRRRRIASASISIVLLRRIEAKAMTPFIGVGVGTSVRRIGMVAADSAWALDIVAAYACWPAEGGIDNAIIIVIAPAKASLTGHVGRRCSPRAWRAYLFHSDVISLVGVAATRPHHVGRVEMVAANAEASS